MDKTIFAHSGNPSDRSDWETLEAHSCAVADAAARRAEAFGGAALARAAGLLHDLGKAKPEFQARLSDDSIRAPHAAEGAKAAQEHLQYMAGRLLAYGIAGHHGGMPNPGALDARIGEARTVALPVWAELGAAAWPAWIHERVDDGELLFRLQFLARMLYSCLVEGDDRETAAFYARLKGREPEAEDRFLEIAAMCAAFERHVARLGREGAVNALRRKVLAHAREGAQQQQGLFTMTVPTGGGKTLASLGFALDHARAHGLRRLIYVIPYMSIIEQTAEVFRRVLGDDAVLEHHSTFDWEGAAGGDDDEAERLRRAAQSWDAPVIVTTAVQFFESLFAARKKRCKKLNALAKCVIVLDEAQTMPLRLLRPCLAALRELMEGYGASIVLCTATQPALTREAGFPAPEALAGARELGPDPEGLQAALRRVRVRDIGSQDDSALASRMRDATQALLIVDNRVQARRLFDELRHDEGAAHLSTLLTPQHRRCVLRDVRGRLNPDNPRPVRLVATSLVEAGVDIDFPLVLRAAAGIDSIAQAAGRCNREGRMESLGEVLIFRSGHKPPAEIEQFARIGGSILARGGDPLSLDSVRAYFRELYSERGLDELDAAFVGPTRVKGILRAIAEAGRGLDFPFADIEAAFRVIEDGQRPVIVRGGRWGIPECRLEELAEQGATALARGAQAYAINVSWSMWREMERARAISWWRPDRFGEQFAVLDNGKLYDDRAGLAVEGFDDAGLLIA